MENHWVPRMRHQTGSNTPNLDRRIGLSLVTARMHPNMGTTVHAVDYAIIGLHFVVTLAVGIWASCRGNRGSPKGYFLAGRNMSWWLVAASLYMSNVGSSFFVGYAGAAAADGIAPICYELTGLFGILLLGFLFIPVYISAGVYTMPEYLQKRFGGKRLQIYFAILQLLWVINDIAVEIYSGAVITKETVGWDLYLSALVILGATALYTILGGLRAVIYTDFLQSVVFIVGATVVAALGLIRIGGHEELQAKYWDAVAINSTVNSTCGQPGPYSFHIMRPARESNYPWPGVVFGTMILSMWYYCNNQVLVQRILAAKDLSHAKGSCVVSAILKPLPLVLMIWPGMISRILYPDIIACNSPEACEAACGNPAGCSDLAYPKLVVKILPNGVRGMMLAAMLAALMSSLTSVFNSACTVFTIDIWKKIRTAASETEQIIVGRASVGVLVALSFALLPVIQSAEGGQIMHFFQGMASYLAPPTVSCFLLAVLWTRTNEKGAFWGLMVGLVLGLSRMLTMFFLPAPPCGELDERPSIVKKLHYLHFATLLFGICLIVTVVVSLLTKPIANERLKGLTWFTKMNGQSYATASLKDADHGSEVDRDNTKMEMKMIEDTGDVIGGDEETKPDDVITVVADENIEKSQGKKTPPSLRKKMWDYLCGFTSETDAGISEAEKSDLERKLRILNMSENPKWRTLVNIGGLLAFSLGIFLWGLLF